MDARSKDRLSSGVRKTNTISICLSGATSQPSVTAPGANLIIGSPCKSPIKCPVRPATSGQSCQFSNVDLLLQQLSTRKQRAECYSKIDSFVDQSLDSVRCKDKKRKIQKLTAGLCKEVDKIDLISPESFLTQVNLKNLLNMQTFHSLPLFYQHKLAKLLPECDQLKLSNGWVTINPAALNNEFFNRAQQLWISRLKENKLAPENSIKRKIDQDKEKLKLDSWKLKHFEPIWGTSKESDACKSNIIDTMYQTKVPTSKRTGIKQTIPSVHFSPNTTLLQLTPVNKTGNNCQNILNKDLSSAKRRKVALTTDDKISNSTRVYLVSNVGKMQQISSSFSTKIINSPVKNAQLIRKLDFSPGSSGSSLNLSTNSSEPGFVPLISQPKNFNIQVVKNPQASKIRINANESASHRRPNKDQNQIICNCSQKAMKLCSMCKCFCHFDCVNVDGICKNCASSSC